MKTPPILGAIIYNLCASPQSMLATPEPANARSTR